VERRDIACGGGTVYRERECRKTTAHDVDISNKSQHVRFGLPTILYSADSRDVFITEELASTTGGEKKKGGYRDREGRPMRGSA
jgi:hypothetical protein